MGFDLYRGSTFAANGELEDWVRPRYSVNVTGWRWLKETALERGWEPVGTVAPAECWRYADSDWDGNYNTNDGQRVTTADAVAWADALEGGWPYPGEPPRWNGLVREFIDYCRGGGFEIW